MDGTILLGADFLGDLEVIRYSSRRRSESVTLAYQSDTYEVICKSARGRIDSNVGLFEVKEIRPGKNSKDFEKWAPETKKIESSRCFVIFYGIEFKLKTLSIVAPSKKEAESWIKGLEFLIDKRPTSYLAKLDIWLQTQYDKMIMQTNQHSITLKQMKDFTNRVSFNISTGKLKENFQNIQDEDGTANIFGFTKLVRQFLHDQQIFTDCFGKYALESRIDLSGFQEFLQREQNEVKYTDYFPFFREYVTSGSKGIAYMNAQEAVDFLFSKQNQVWNKKYDTVHQDMTRPMSCYWIASSHNTYLTGDQVSSESSVEAYARCLRLGCRCIELDCWDGADGYPVIYHGRTLTTKIPFVEVLKTIKEHAFVKSDYPVILSIENHCSVKQQKIMAKKFEEIFGKMLVTNPLSRDETELPSPHQLRRRIIIKGKKLPKHAKEIIKEVEKENMDLSDTFKNGKMFLQEGSRWEPYFFALTNEKLTYTEIDEGNEAKDYEYIDQGLALPIEELHYSKKWFHGRIPGGVKSAEERVKKFGVEGGFLVRSSEGFPGEYSICFLSQGRAHNIRIKSNPQQTHYCLIPSKQFDSLYSLVSHYRKSPLETRDFYIERFTKPVPQPEKHEQEPWFYPNSRYPEPMDRKKAEEVLQKIPLNGAFLVRYSSDSSTPGAGRFVISFRIENAIKHCRVKEDGRLLVVSNQRFENIERLVNYYSTKSFYKGLKLKHAVTEELYKFAHSVEAPEDDKVYSSPDYLDTTNATAQQVRALYSYEPSDPDCLKFERGDVITNVVKQDGVWWKGDLDDQIQKTFPVNFVEEIEPVDSPFGELQKGSLALGRADVEKGVDENYPYILKVQCPNSLAPFKAALKSYREAKEWQETINFVKTRITRTQSQSYQIQKKNKIAQELSKQIVYCCTIPKLIPDDVRTRGRVYNEMTSFTEVTADKQMSTDPEFYVWYHEVQFSRVYPKAQRVDSSNYNPIRFWNFGCQMVALNYQTPDRPMQLNHGKFRQNGGCGYVLRPDFMFRNNFHPSRIRDLDVNGIQPLTFKITVIAARQLQRAGNKVILNPYVEVEIIGADFDCQKVRTTKYIGSNGFNPFWNEKFTIKVLNPDLALIRFSVSDEDSFADSHFVGQATYPARCLLQGYRSVPLENDCFGDECISRLLILLQHNHTNSAAKCLLQGYRSVPLENGLGEDLISSMIIHLTHSYDLHAKVRRS